MPEKRWKAYERTIMHLLGGRRIPVTGRAGPGGDPGDGGLAGFYIEVRDHARPRPIRWFREVVQEAADAGGIPLLIFKGPSRALSPLVILRLADLAEVIARGRRGGAAGPDPAGEGGAAGADAGTDPGSRPQLRGVSTPPPSRYDRYRP